MRTKKFTVSLSLVTCLLVAGFAVADEWQPPENPDPSTILNEAKADAASGEYEVALAKHLWYHENATKLEPSQSGVRRSFALSYWLSLGEKYPPAIDKMRAVQDAVETRIRDENQIRVRFEDFHDFVALNKTLRKEKKTAETFKWLSEYCAEDADRMYGVAEAALIKQKEYAICGEYVEPEKDASRIGESYVSGLDMAKRFGKHHRDYVEKKVVNDAAMLVAILVQNDRKAEAGECVETIQRYVRDGKVSKKLDLAINKAMDGTVPTPWP